MELLYMRGSQQKETGHMLFSHVCVQGSQGKFQVTYSVDVSFRNWKNRYEWLFNSRLTPASVYVFN